MKKFITIFLLTISSLCSAQLFNSDKNSVKMIIPFPPGGGTDIAFKHFQKYIEETSGLVIIPTYKPGADSLIGLSEIAAAKNNGSTIGFVTIAGIATYKNKYPDYQFDYISMISKPTMAVITHTNSGIKTINDLEVEIKAKKITKSFAFGAPAQKIALNQLFLHNKTTPPDFIPYKGANPLLNDLLGGHIDVAVVPLNIVKSQIDSKKIVLIATTVKINETTDLYKRYPNWESNDGFAIVLPNNTNTEVHIFWGNLIQKYLTDTSTVEYFTTEHIEPSKFGPATLKAHVDSAIKNVK
jgi:tripartite-type tricarboxylate transporter receptor subunit TctC